MFFKVLTRAFFVFLVLIARSAFADFREFSAIPASEKLQNSLKLTAQATLKDFPKMTADNLALSVIDLTNAGKITRGDYHGDAPFYPASVIKLFLMVDAFREGKMTPELDRALHEMIGVSDNDATGYVIDLLTGTTSGPELDEQGVKEMLERRGKFNRYFNALGYDISAMLKPWSFGPFGRDMQLMKDQPQNRNRATANAVASLLLWIEQGRAVSPEASKAMMELMARPLSPPRPAENQVKGYLGEGLPEGTKLWSKAGDTSEVRHDAAYLELPEGRKLIVVVFTRGDAEDAALLPAIGRNLLEQLK